MKLLVLEDIELHARTFKPGTVLNGLGELFCRELILDGKAEPVEHSLPEDYPARTVLLANGYLSEEQVQQASPKQLMKIDGLGAKRLEKIKNYNQPNKTNEE